MYPFDKVHGAQQIGLASARCPAALIDTGYGASFTSHDGAASQGVEVMGVPHTNPRHTREGQIGMFHAARALCVSMVETTWAIVPHEAWVWGRIVVKWEQRRHRVTDERRLLWFAS